MIFVSSRESAEDVWEPSADGRQPVHIRDFADFLIFCDPVRENTVPNRKSGSNDLQNFEKSTFGGFGGRSGPEPGFWGDFFCGLGCKNRFPNRKSDPNDL